MMNSKRLVWSFTVLLLFSALASHAHSATVGEKAALQAAMQQHIDRNLVEGAFLHLDTETGRVRQLYPQSPHPMILRMSEYFVLCSDFKDGACRSVNVDFYIARDSQSYVIFHSAVDDRANLQRRLSNQRATGELETELVLHGACHIGSEDKLIIDKADTRETARIAGSTERRS